MTTETSDDIAAVSLPDALAVAVRDEVGTTGPAAGRTIVDATVHPGYDVFTIPHGGYLAALAGSAVLAATGSPDVFSLTVHFLRKGIEGPMTFEVDAVGGSRRFTSVHARATQDGQAVLSVLATVGDRAGIDGPNWARHEPWVATDDQLAPPANADDLEAIAPGFTPPNIARRFSLQPDLESFAFARGEVTGDPTLRARMQVDQPDQLTALVACDVTPPAIWNALGVKGWVPTIELTAHVRSRPSPGPLTVVASTDHVTDGFLEEDALVHDAQGHLVVQSRQLARWTGA